MRPRSANFLWFDPNEESPKLMAWYEYDKTPIPADDETLE